jgi:hypothetical protein
LSSIQHPQRRPGVVSFPWRSRPFVERDGGGRPGFLSRREPLPQDLRL